MFNALLTHQSIKPHQQSRTQGLSNQSASKWRGVTEGIQEEAVARLTGAAGRTKSVDRDRRPCRHLRPQEEGPAEWS
ncbi:uncharacterized protein ColSpa_02702 [Colletotrichum spaethianum]|uniref:Uncharacterized protein n=1 Tax=Colletotrichum spaethianum TaxID=700344 RepID=A0AA37L5Q5_9PEZI|nr:uncharacterized protein ColSpa_02702 [Colletotrichum spaethianum]GKT42521.1 hypothetical protein ColSpa_02702 [Colletotrichum spaethianum]